MCSSEKPSEAQSELDRREWRMQNGDSALHETGIQLQSRRMELYHSSQLNDQTQMEKSWLCNELEMRSRACQEDRARSSYEVKKLRKICCAEAARARQLRIDELSTPEEESKSTYGEIQELQNKANSLSDAKEFHDPSF